MKKTAFLIGLVMLLGSTAVGHHAAAETSASKEAIDCPFDTNSTEEGVVLAWVTNIREFTQFGMEIKTETITVGSFRPFALLTKAGLVGTLGATIYIGQPFWRVLSPSSGPLKLASVGSFYDHLVDQCAYYGMLDKADLPLRTLLSSKPLPGVFRVPREKDRKEFYRLNKSCVVQGDYPEGKTPTCTRPTLLAISDINKNGKPEYWATQPYIWDTGLAVWEKNAKGNLILLLEVCVACDD